jgi:photosystem II stability/assembly factor-like uncharacterized protein
MKIIVVVILAVFAPLACQDLRHPDPEVGFSRSATYDGARITLSRRVENPFPIYDIVLADGKVLGILKGIRTTKGQYVQLSEGDTTWTTKTVTIPDLEWEDIGAAFSSDGNVWFVTKTGYVLKSNIATGEWMVTSHVEASEPSLITFLDRETGYIISDIFTREYVGCQIFKTEDSGRTWKKVYENNISGNASAVIVPDKETILLAVNDEYLIESRDGGKTWHPRGLGYDIQSFDKVFEVDRTGAKDFARTANGDIWIVGEKSSVFSSTDLGLSWKRITGLPTLTENLTKLTSIAFSPDGEGVIVGFNGLILVSRDFGKSWTQLGRELTDSVLLNDPSERTPDNLFKVVFSKGIFTILGRRGLYQLSYH